MLETPNAEICPKPKNCETGELPFKLLIDPRFFISAQIPGFSVTETQYVNLLSKSPELSVNIVAFIGYERNFVKKLELFGMIISDETDRALSSLKGPVDTMLEAHRSFLVNIEKVVKRDTFVKDFVTALTQSKDVVESHQSYILKLILIENFVNEYCATRPPEVIKKLNGEMMIQMFKLPLAWQKYAKSIAVELVKSLSKIYNQDLIKCLEEFTIASDTVYSSIDSIPKLEQISKMFLIEPFPIAITGRRFIREGRAMKQCRKAVTERVVLLFSDVFIYVQPKGGKYMVPASYKLMYLRAVPCEYDRSCLDIYAPRKSFTLKFTNEEERDSWYTSLKDAIANAQVNVRIPKYKEAPIWIPDAVSSVCMACNTPLHFFRRRHHCRNCGKIMCRACLSHRLVLKHISSRLSMVCNQCYESICEGNGHPHCDEEENEEVHMKVIQSVISEETDDTDSDSEEEDTGFMEFPIPLYDDE